MREVMSSDAAECCDGMLFGPDAPIYRKWKSDSREIAPGDAFVAIKGENTDGHLYVHQAIERGAKIILVEIEEVDKLSLNCSEFGGVTVIAANNTTTALAKIARMYLAKLAPDVIGITGSVGKTTTRELAVSVLKSKFKVHSAIRSFNTIIGCSLTILAMPLDTEILILELGTNHFGEIHQMVTFFPLDFAIITEIAPAHLEGFGDVEGVSRAKLEICEPKKLKHIIYNSDSKLLVEAMSYKFNNVIKTGVGYGEKSELQILNTKISLDELGSKIKVRYSFYGVPVILETSLFGEQHAYNIGYAYAVGIYFGISDPDIVLALLELKPLAGRGVCKKLENNAWVIDEAYNANPSSMRAAIANILNITESQQFRKIAVLGGMRELGKSSAFWHENIIAMIEKFDKVILVGEEWYDESLTIPANARRYKVFEEIVALITADDMSDSIILIKGSNYYGLKNLVALLTEG